MAYLSPKRTIAWQEGNCIDAYERLGAHPMSGEGVRFAVWAPHAKSVCVVGDFNDWNHRTHKMSKDSSTGIWQAAIPEAGCGQCYKFYITSSDGTARLKADPYGFYHEKGSHHASIIYEWPHFNWSDDAWMSRRFALHQPDEPLSVYEVHVGSWRRSPSGDVLSYRALADKLIPYVKEMGFTHIELMPVMEHPYGPSWGYQVTGFYAPTSRYGSPEDFMAFIDACHQNNIGVILDWVAGHFPKDEHGLAFFDGTPLYEHADERRRVHADWGTHNFDFEKPGVRNFLLSNAFFWCEKYHVDGFRIDAVASMLYLDYSKEAGEWLPNTFGGKENLGAVAFLQDLNGLLKEHYPSVLTIAEESTSWVGVTHAVSEGGLGFDYKWNMGWMNDTLHFFEQPPQKRSEESHSITFPVTFAFKERFILPFSHDEVVHLKKSLWSKMPGTLDEKFAQLKLLFLYLVGFPGKKLLFMGNELAEREEWAEGRALNWSLLDTDGHKEIKKFVTSLLHFYRSAPVLHQTDHTADGFEWEDLSRKEKGMYAFARIAKESAEKLIFVFNFSAQQVAEYQIEADAMESYRLLFDTLQAGDGILNIKITDPVSLKPLQGVVLRRE
ncbi:MAG: 1,4-alpha-glucan branching protein GlgB [Balneolaceae bacterium]|nr:1,4-alpha-glucan branching protein GlgB [Balneolaceae bacterium]